MGHLVMGCISHEAERAGPAECHATSQAARYHRRLAGHAKALRQQLSALLCVGYTISQDLLVRALKSELEIEHRLLAQYQAEYDTLQKRYMKDRSAGAMGDQDYRACHALMAMTCCSIRCIALCDQFIKRLQNMKVTRLDSSINRSCYGVRPTMYQDRKKNATQLESVYEGRQLRSAKK